MTTTESLRTDALTLLSQVNICDLLPAELEALIDVLYEAHARLVLATVSTSEVL